MTSYIFRQALSNKSLFDVRAVDVFQVRLTNVLSKVSMWFR